MHLVGDGAIFVRMVDNCTKYVADLTKRLTRPYPFVDVINN